MPDPPPPLSARHCRGGAVTLSAGLLLGAGIMWLIGWADRVPADPHDAPSFGAPEAAAIPAADGQFRLAIWNVHRFVGSDGVENVEATAGALNDSGFDVALLQETPGDGDGFDLGGRTGAAAAFVGTEDRFGRTHIGNAVLTRLAAGPVHRLPLPDTRGKAFRTAVLTTVRVPTGTNPGGEPVRVLGVHLATTADQAVQVERVTDLFLSLRAPCVLAGDFNQPIDSPLLEPLREAPGVTNALAAIPRGERDVDHVFVRGLTASNARAALTSASDHPLYAVDLRLGPVAGTAPAGGAGEPR